MTAYDSQHSGTGSVSDTERDPGLSIVVPMFNEAATLDAFFARLNAVLAGLGLTSEVICVDDGSSDRTWEILAARQARDPRLRTVRLSRNFGKDIALTAGLRHARGKAVVPIDADLQHPPEQIPVFIAKWREGYDMVYGVRRSRATDPWARRVASRAFYRLFGRLSKMRLPAEAGDFRLLDRRVVDILNAMPERARFMKGLFAWVGFRHVGVEYDVAERQVGSTSWSPRRLFGFAFDGIASFSTFPLVLSGYLGAAIALPSVLLGLFFIIRTLIWGVDVPGYASVMVAVLFLGGVQLLIFGLFGAYLGRVFEEVKGRPLYIVSERRGFDDVSSAPRGDRPASDRDADAAPYPASGAPAAAPVRRREGGGGL